MRECVPVSACKYLFILVILKLCTASGWKLRFLDIAKENTGTIRKEQRDLCSDYWREMRNNGSSERKTNRFYVWLYVLYIRYTHRLSKPKRFTAGDGFKCRNSTQCILTYELPKRKFNFQVWHSLLSVDAFSFTKTLKQNQLYSKLKIIHIM